MAQNDKPRQRRGTRGARAVQPEPAPGQQREGRDQPAAAASQGVDPTSRRVLGARREHVDAMNEVSASLNELLARIHREWVAAHFGAHAQYMQHLDQTKLQNDLQGAGEAYWSAVREATDGASQRMAGSYQSYLGAIKDAVAEVDVENADPATLSLLAQSLHQAATLAACQQQQARQVDQRTGG